MPKAKKKSMFFGVGKKHVVENYDTLPTDLAEMKSGHVLHSFLITCEQSRARTERHLQEHFAILSNTLNNQIRNLTTRYNKFHKLTDDCEFKTFVDFCQQPFAINVANEPGQSITALSPTTSQGESLVTTVESVSSQDEPQSSTSQEHHIVSQLDQVRDHSRTPITPRKLKMKKRLDFISLKRSAEKKKYIKTIKSFKQQITNPKRVINQAIKRKTETISSLKDKLSSQSKTTEIAETKQKLSRLKTAHEKLKTYNRNRRKMSVPISQYRLLQEKLIEKNARISELENKTMELHEEIQGVALDSSDSTVNLKSDQKTYSINTRMLVFDHIANQVPTANIQTLIKQTLVRLGKKTEDVPNRTTVELMARELGALAEFQTADKILQTDCCTIGFDATTQEGTHINEVHFTFEKECFVASVEELPGGTAADYADHLISTVDNLCESFCYFKDIEDRESVKKKMIGNIKNSMSDRCAANGAALRLVCSNWRKSLNQLNCHLHPLDSIASAVRRSLKDLEESRGKVFGSDCIAACLVLAINKLRFKDGKGDPRGFLSFLDKNNLPHGLLPRYRGNRLHVLFEISGILIEKYELFLDFFKSGPVTCGGLRLAIYQDFSSELGKVQLCVLGLIGKLLTAPWMKTFYTSSSTEINHVEGIVVVKNVVKKLKDMIGSPEELISTSADFFEKTLQSDDVTLSEIRKELSKDQNRTFYVQLMTSCLESIVKVLERQYSSYFNIDIDEKLKEETRSARSHNIDAEEIMGMYSASQKRAPNATICFLSSRMCARKNRTVAYLDSLAKEEREKLLAKAVSYGRKKRDTRRIRQKDLRVEMIKRQDEKKQKKEQKERKALEKKLKSDSLENVLADFPSISESDKLKLSEMLKGKLSGRNIVHVWYEEQGIITYNGKLEKFKKGGKYKVAYWRDNEVYDNATDWDIPNTSLAVDFLLGDLLICEN